MPANPAPRIPAWPPRSAPRLFITDELGAGRIFALEGNQAHYLNKVMRVREGDTIILCDDITGAWAARIAEVGKRSVQATVTEQLQKRETVPDVWLCPALLKKDRFDTVLEKATELGVANINPVLTRRCVADKLNLDRAQTLVTEAAEQCARTALPQVLQPQKLAKLLDDWPNGRTLFFADEMGGQPAAQQFAANAGPAAILIGPEGGFDDAERQMLLDHAAVVPITLGPRILRGETAAMATLAVWMAARGDWTN